MSTKSKRHTKNPMQRAADIADHEVKKACQKCRQCEEAKSCGFFHKWLSIFETSVKEFSWPESVTE